MAKRVQILTKIETTTRLHKIIFSILKSKLLNGAKMRKPKGFEENMQTDPPPRTKSARKLRKL